MAWIYVLAAGLLEVVWAVGLKYTDGFTRLWPSMVGAAVLGIVLFDEPTHATRIFFLSLLIVSLVGLRLTSGPA